MAQPPYHPVDERATRPRAWQPIAMFLTLCIGQCAIAAIALFVSHTVPGAWKPRSTWPWAGAAVLNNILLLSIVAWMGSRFNRVSIVHLLGKRVTSCQIVLAILMALSVMPISLIISGARPILGPIPVPLALMAVNAITLTPVAEELFFRGYILGVYGRVSRQRAIGVSVVLFCLYHFDGTVISLVSSCPFAIVTCYIWLKTHSVYPAVLGHAVYNATVTATQSALTASDDLACIAMLCLVACPLFGLWLRAGSRPDPKS